jgi:Putative bacterial sensory transduction regulator
MILKLAAIASVLIGATCQASGQSPPTPKSEPATAAQPELISSVNLESVQKILQGMGFECVRDRDEKGNLEKFFTFQAAGYKVVVRTPSAGSIWLYNIFTNEVSLEAINEWNQNNNFNHAYIGKDKKLFFDTDIVVHGGVTRENIEAQIKSFRDALARWARFVIDHSRPNGPGSSK